MLFRSMFPIIDCMKQGEFVWTKDAVKAFNEVKQKMTEALVMRLPDFTKPFEVECDASGLGIGGVLSQERHPIAYFSEKLNDAKKSTPHMTKNFMPLFELFGIGAITCCLENLLSTLIMKLCAISFPKRS